MSELSSAYSDALFELATERGESEEILHHCRLLWQIADETPELLRFLDAPTVSAEDKLRLADKAFKDVLNRDLLNFLKVMIRRKDTRRLKASLDGYEELYNSHNNIEKATVITAVPMSRRLTERLEEKLRAVTGKNIVLTNKVDPACIGGVVLQFSDTQFDDSISHKLELLKNRLSDVNGTEQNDRKAGV